MLDFSGMRNHSFRFGLRLLSFFFGILFAGVVFLVCFDGILLGAGKFSLMRLLLRCEVLLLRVARCLLCLRFSNLLSEGGGFVFAQVLSREVFLDWRVMMCLLEMVRGRDVRRRFHVHKHVRFVRLSFSWVLFCRCAVLTLLDRRGRSLRVLLDRMLASLPLRERFAGQRFETA
jgi:hypothetical protein